MTISSKRWEDIKILILCVLVMLPLVNIVPVLVAWAVRYFNVFNWVG